MEEIINYNYGGLCIEIGCSKKHTHYTYKVINGMKIIISLCKKHSEIYDQYLYDRLL